MPWTTEELYFGSLQRLRLFSSSLHENGPLGPPSFLTDEYQGKNGQDVKPTTDFYLLEGLRIGGAVRPPPYIFLL
jgi:hypothetical protein